MSMLIRWRRSAAAAVLPCCLMNSRREQLLRPTAVARSLCSAVLLDYCNSRDRCWQAVMHTQHCSASCVQQTLSRTRDFVASWPSLLAVTEDCRRSDTNCVYTGLKVTDELVQELRIRDDNGSHFLTRDPRDSWPATHDYSRVMTPDYCSFQSGPLSGSAFKIKHYHCHKILRRNNWIKLTLWLKLCRKSLQCLKKTKYKTP